MIGRSLNADLRKMKGTSVILAHLLIPIITSVIFLIYYFFSPWNENMKVIAFYQAIGAGLPVLIGIFTASVMEQEQNAGDFQNLLSLPDKPAAFLSKLLMLLVLCLCSILLTAIIFGIGFGRIASSDIEIMKGCIFAALLLWGSSVPLYLWQLILAFNQNLVCTCFCNPYANDVPIASCFTKWTCRRSRESSFGYGSHCSGNVSLNHLVCFCNGSVFEMV
jgi:lantibiotic transport system permease protein